jgi:hypothetical protein
MNSLKPPAWAKADAPKRTNNVLNAKYEINVEPGTLSTVSA